MIDEVIGENIGTYINPGISWSVLAEKNRVYSEEEIKQLVDEKVREVLGDYLRERSYSLRTINNKDAKREIEKFIKERHQEGIFKISIFDLVSNLRIPGEQAERIMRAFENKGRVKEI